MEYQQQQPFSGFSPFAVGSPDQQIPGLASRSSPSASRLPSMSSTAGLGGFASPDQSAATSPSMMSPAIAAAELLGKGNAAYSPAGAPPNSSYRSPAATLAAAGRQLSAGSAFQNPALQFYHQQQPNNAALGSPWRSLSRIPSAADDALAAAVAAAGLAGPPPPPPPYSTAASPLNRASTASAHQLLLQQQQLQQQQLQQAALARSLSVDVGMMSAQGAGGYLGAGGRWGSGRLPYDASGMSAHQDHQQGRFGSVYDMKSLTAALAHVQAGTGDVRRMLAACTFRPRLPGLTKLVSQMSREGHWAKSLEVYESLDAVAVRPDTTITNAAISACDKGGQWEKALQIFKSMSDLGMERDAITYSALISALSKGRQWGLAIDVFNHMVAEGVECDAVTCCSLITALDKGGQWQLAEQVFIQMYRHHPQFHVLLEGMDTETADASDGTLPGGNNGSEIGRASSLLQGTFTTAALNALSISEDVLPPPEQLLAMLEASGGQDVAPNTSRDQADKHPTQPGDPADAVSSCVSGKSASYLTATQGIALQAVNACTHGTTLQAVNACIQGNAVQAGNACTQGIALQGGKACTNSASGSTGTGKACTNNLPGAHSSAASSSSSCSHGSATTPGACNSTSSAQLGVSSTHCTTAPATRMGAYETGTATGFAADTNSSSNGVHSQPKPENAPQQLHGQDTEVTGATLSCVWSKILASKALAEAHNSAQNSMPAAVAEGALASSSNTTDGAGSPGRVSSSDDSLLTASDAIVHLMPTSKFRLIDAKSTGAAAAAAATTTTTTSDPAPPLKPGTSAFAAAGATPLDATGPPAASSPDQTHPKGASGGPSSPQRPPLHPTKHGSTAAALHTPGAAGASHGPSPAGSLGLVSPGSASPARTGSGNMLRLGLTRSLNSKKSSPNRVCCNALLAAYARATPPRWRQALKLLEVMWTCGGELVPDIVSYNTVMKACGNAQQTDRAFELYEHMQQRGIEPTVATFGTLITIASEAQAYDKVKQSWGWLQTSGLPVHITCVNSYLTALIKEDNWDAAVDLFQQLKSNQLGVRPNSVTYNILMSACLTRGRPQSVKGLFDEMTAANLSPTLISYNALLQSYGKMGAYEHSLGVLQQMCTSSPVRPSTASFSTVFETLKEVAVNAHQPLKQELAERARQVFNLMSQLPGLHPDSVLYRTIVNTFSACLATKMVLDVVLLMREQGHTLDATSASSALTALQAEEAWTLSGPLLASCLDVGVVVQPLVLQHILLVATHDRAWRVAKEVLQVASAAHQLDDVARLLRETRTELQKFAELQDASGINSSLNQTLMQRPGLVADGDGLDQLLFLTYLQAQFSNGGWSEAIQLFKQLQQSRGPDFAVFNGTLLGSLLELLVGRGGAAGSVEAIPIVDTCHAKGVMAHYVPALGPDGNIVAGNLRPPATPDQSPAAAAAAGNLLSPEQQVIWQLESNSNPAAAPASSSSGMAAFSLFPGLSAAPQTAPHSRGLNLDLSSGVNLRFDHGLDQGSGGMSSYRGLQLPDGRVPLSLLDVRGCSAVEALVLALSWLGQLVVVVAAGQAPACARLRIETGSAGPMDPAQAIHLKLTHAAADPAAAAVQEGAQAGHEGAGETAGDAAENGSAHKAAAPAGSEEDQGADPVAAATAAAAGTNSTTLQPPPGVAAAAAAAAAASSSVLHAGPLQVPGSRLSVHTVVLALLSGQLPTMLGCAEPVELLLPFSAAGKVPLGLVCLSSLPVSLPDEMYGGGIELDVTAATALITAMVSMGRSA